MPQNEKVKELLKDNKFELFSTRGVNDDGRSNYSNHLRERSGPFEYTSKSFIKTILSHKWDGKNQYFDCNCGAKLVVRTKEQCTHHKDKAVVVLTFIESKGITCTLTEEDHTVADIIK